MAKRVPKDIEERAAARRRELSARAEAAGISRTELARRVGRSLPTITKFLDGAPSRAEVLAVLLEDQLRATTTRKRRG